MNTVKCNDININGQGIVNDENKLIYVDNLLPNEEARIHLTSKKRGFYLGKVVERISSSNDRVNIKCNICGGCNFPHLSYEKQLELKTREVKNTFKTNDVNPCVRSEDIYYYRNKIQSPIRRRQDKLVRGMYEEGTQKFIKVNKCYLENEEAQSAIDDVLFVLNEHHFEQDIKTIYARIAISNNDIMIALISLEKLNISEDIINEIIERNSNIKTIINSIKDEDNNVILGKDEVVLYGDGFIVDKLLDNDFKISLHSFYQINKKQTERLYDYAIKQANLNKDDVVLDCYSGIGTIGISCADKCNKVIGVEVVESAVMNAMENLRINDINNVQYLLNDATKIFKNIGEHVNVVFLDPSRKGCSREFIDNLIKLSPDRIVYISCNIETQVRDVEFLKKYYEIKDIQPFDLFPLTKHIENIILLNKK